MAETLEEARALRAAIDALARKIDETPVKANTATVSVNAGGFGIWIASTCAAISMTMCLAMGGVILNQQEQIQRLNDYLVVIYTRAPHLAPDAQP